MALRHAASSPAQQPQIDVSSFSLVVPMYNEEDRFSENARQLAEFILDQGTGSELIFVDDGSQDRTADLVQSFLEGSDNSCGRLIRRPHRGKGSAVRAGLAAATGMYAGFCDIDLSTPLPEFVRVLDAARQSSALAIGSRGAADSELLLHQGHVREALGWCYNRLIQLTLAPGVSDTQCGAKAAHSAVWQKILPHCRESGLAWDAEAVAIARRLGLAVEEVSVVWAHDERSKVRMARDGPAMVAAVPRILLNVLSIPSSKGR